MENNSNEIFNSEKPSKLKRAFQIAGSFLGGLSGDGINFGWNQGGLTYDYLEAKLGAPKADVPPATPQP